MDKLVTLSFSDYDATDPQSPVVLASREPNDFTSGPVPEDFSDLAGQLSTISLAFNNFNDTGLPTALKNAVAAQSIYMQANKFSGPMNIKDMMWGNLRILNLESNGFSGDFPSDELSIQDSWEVLNVANNPRLVGAVSDVLCDQIVSAGSDTSGAQAGTLRLLNIENTDIACVAKCYMDAMKTNPSFDLLIENEVKVCDLNSDMEALQELYASLQLAGNPLFSSWDFDASSDPCSWYGVFCDTSVQVTGSARLLGSGSVSELQLASSNLEGELPGGLGKLSNLRVLNMSFNSISGSIPSNYWTDMSSLQTFDMRSNGIFMFSDEMDFSAAASKGTPLTNLLLSRNHFMGPLPKGLSLLPNLQTLDIASNYLTGSIDEFNNPVAALKVLLMADNFFTGPLSGCGLVGHASYIDARTSMGHSWECVDQCWAPVIDGSDTTTKLVRSGDIKFCGGNPGSPTMQPTHAVDDDALPGMPTRMPGPGDDDFPLPGMPTNMPGPGDDDLPIFMPTRGPTMMPTRMPGPSDDDFPLRHAHQDAWPR